MYTISNADKITPENYSHLEGSSRLKQTFPYFYQIQHQLGVTGREHRYFFMYTPIAYHLERIEFDPILWKDMVYKFEYLWRGYVAPEILKKRTFIQLGP